MTEQKQRRKPRKYTDEFKQQLVELYRSGKRRCDICREYDIATLLWSSIFVTLVAKKYHESVTLPSGLRMVYDNH